MTDLDVALRLKLVNQLSRPAEEAERDLKELQQAAERLGRVRGGDQLGADIRQIGAAADGAKGKLGLVGAEADDLRRKLGTLDNANGLDGVGQDAVEAKQRLAAAGQEADDLRRKLGRIDDTAGLDGLKTDADAAKRALETIGTGADDARRKIEWLDAEPLDKLKAEAAAAEAAIRGIGTAANASQDKLDRLDATQQPAPRARPHGLDRPVTNEAEAERLRRNTGRTTARDAFGAAVDRSGADAYVDTHGSLGRNIGLGVTAGAAAAYKAYEDFAGFDREMRLAGNSAKVPQETVDAGISQLRKVAMDVGVPVKDVLDAFKRRLASTGQWEGSLEQMRDVAITSKTAGASSEDVVQSFLAAQRSLGISPERLLKAADIMYRGGTEGEFELREQARYLPGLLSQAGSKGYQGEEGLASIIASLQIIAQRSGGNDKAALQLGEVLGKMDAEETANNFKDFGVDLPSRLKKGRAEGLDLVNVLLDAVEDAIKGDASRIGLLFREKDSQAGVTNLRAGRQDRDRLATELQRSDGAVRQDFRRVENDPLSGLDRVKNVIERATVATGSALDKLGLTWLLNRTAEGMEGLGDDPLSNAPKVWYGAFPAAFAADALKAMLGKPASDADSAGDGPRHVEERERDRSLEHWMPLPGRGGIHEALGVDAEEMESLRQKLGRPMDDAAHQSMGSYNDALKQEGANAVSITQGIVEQLRSMLNFTAGPTIQPTLAPATAAPAPAAAPAGVQKSSALPVGGNVRLTQNISAPNSTLAARRAMREQNRAVRLAQDRALHDLGSLA